MDAVSAVNARNDKGSVGNTPLLRSRYRPGHRSSPGIWRFRESLPDLPAVTLGEGSTPLLPLERIAAGVGGARLLAKLECLNPTGSFKDRGSALVAAAARHAGAASLALASTGNAGASMAAYAARAGIRLRVVTPKSIDPGKRWQITAHGAELELCDGDLAACDELYRRLVASGSFAAGADNPLRQQGTKTLAYEIFEECGGVVDRVIAPVGTGGLVVALQMGFDEICAALPGFKPPVIDAVQLEALKPLDGFDPARAVVRTAATGINIANPLMRDSVTRIVRESGGIIHAVSEAALLEAREALAQLEGVGAEPTGSVTTAAYLQARKSGRIRADEAVVVIVTGHTLKAPVQVPGRRGDAQSRAAC